MNERALYAHGQTDIHTDTLIAILRPPTRGEVTNAVIILVFLIENAVKYDTVAG